MAEKDSQGNPDTLCIKTPLEKPGQPRFQQIQLDTKAVEFYEKHFKTNENKVTIVPPIFSYKDDRPEYKKLETPLPSSESKDDAHRHLKRRQRRDSQTKCDEAERIIFQRLEQLNEAIFVLRGLDYLDYYKTYGHRETNDDNEQIKGDHDFVIIHRRGVMFMQVKASNNKKNRKVIPTARKQLEKDVHMLRKITKNIEDPDLAAEVQSLLSNGNHLQLVVATPYLQKCDKANHGTVSLYQEDIENGKAFEEWWKKTTGGTADNISEELYDFLAAKYIYIRHLAHEGNSCKPAALTADCYNDISRKLTSEEWLLLIPEQLNLLNDETRFKYIDGPPGSGKTQILVLKIQKILETYPNETVLVITVGKGIAKKIERDLQHDTRVTVKTVDPRKRSLNLNAVYYKGKIQKYDHIFSDESQGISRESISFLQDHFLSDNEHGYFWVFLDKAQILPKESYFNSIGSYLLGYKMSNLTELKTILRMTLETADLCKKYDTEDRKKDSVGHKVVGPKVQFHEYSIEQVHSLIDGTNKHHTTILFDNNEDLSNFKKKSEIKYRFESAEGNVENCKEVTLDTIGNFRGLEDEVVIVCLANKDFNPISNTELLHTAFSRSYCSLHICRNHFQNGWLASFGLWDCRNRRAVQEIQYWIARQWALIRAIYSSKAP